MNTKNNTINNIKVRLGMIGGGPDSFIGSIHRIAALMDGHYEIVCGVFSTSYEKSLITGREIGIDEERIYKTELEMFEKESQLEEGSRMEVVSIVTPNNLHYIQTKQALKYNFNVILDKPLCNSLEEALELQEIISNSTKKFCLTHTYTGYPMIKEAKFIVKSGVIGKIRKVSVEYPQGWLTRSIEKTGHKQAAWRNDEKVSGKSCCLGDIGTHAFNLLEYVTGLKVNKLFAEVSTFVEGRVLDDDATILLRLENEAKGVIQSSQILTGEENSLRIQVWGEEGGVEWCQLDPNTLKVKKIEGPMQIYRAGTNFDYLSKHSRLNLRTPGGHPEGYLEAFANIYRSFYYEVKGKSVEEFDFPSIEEGVRGMKFIDLALVSSRLEKWVDFI